MKYVESYWAEELPNGVIHLLINCSQREIYFHSFTANWFLICGTQEEYDNMNKDCYLNIEEKFVPDNKDVTYVMSSMKEKDQISFYWIPFERGKRNKNRKILCQN